MAYLHNYFRDLEQARFDGPVSGGDLNAESIPRNDRIEAAVHDYFTASESGSCSDVEADQYTKSRRFARGVDMKLVSRFLIKISKNKIS